MVEREREKDIEEGGIGDGERDGGETDRQTDRQTRECDIGRMKR